MVEVSNELGRHSAMIEDLQKNVDVHSMTLKEIKEVLTRVDINQKHAKGSIDEHKSRVEEKLSKILTRVEEIEETTKRFKYTLTGMATICLFIGSLIRS